LAPSGRMIGAKQIQGINPRFNPGHSNIDLVHRERAGDQAA
jgi:hypothetical protein